LRTTTKFEWDNRCEATFQELKHKLITAPVLALPAEGGDFTIYSDASRQGTACDLMQDGKATAYASKQLKPCEKNYYP